jgi:DNA-binding MarR family transcriptional regulator
MEKRGYLKRVRDKEDRRRVVVELTARAKKRLWEIYGPIATHAYETLRRYSDKELQLFLHFVLEGEQFLERHTRRLHTTRSPNPPVNDG